MDTLRALETAIAGFAGSVMCISHDRWFLDRLATHILAFEGDSKVTSESSIPILAILYRIIITLVALNLKKYSVARSGSVGRLRCLLWSARAKKGPSLQVVWFEGGYSEYEADLKKRNGGADPTKIKFRRMALN